MNSTFKFSEVRPNCKLSHIKVSKIWEISKILLTSLLLLLVQRAINQLSSGKAPSIDGISVETLEQGSTTVLTQLTELLDKIWTEGKFRRTSRTLSQFTFASVKMTALAAIIILTSRATLLRWKSTRSCPAESSVRPLHLPFSPRANVGSALVAAQLT